MPASRARWAYSRYAARCSPTAVLPVPGAPCTHTVCSRGARTSRSCSGCTVATMSRIGPLRGRSISPSSSALTAVCPGQPVVLVRGERALAEPEPAAQRDALPVLRRRPVVRARHRRPPVDDHRLPVRAADVAAPDVEHLVGLGVEPAEEQRRHAVVEQLVEAACQARGQRARGRLVVAPRALGLEQRAGVLAHPAQVGAGAGQVGALTHEDAVGVGRGHGVGRDTGTSGTRGRRGVPRRGPPARVPCTGGSRVGVGRAVDTRRRCRGAG